MSRNILLYATDHGFGHATRMLALAELLHARGHGVTLCAGAAAALAQRSLRRLHHTARGVPHAVPAHLDFGLVPRADAMGVDDHRSAVALSAWLDVLPEHIQRESERIHALHADLVIADVPAVAVAAAELAGVPAVVCSNFTWLDNYGDRFGERLVHALSRAYGAAALGLRLSPGRLALRGVPRVRDVPGVLGRRTQRSRAAVRAELGVPQDALLLGVGLGRSLDRASIAALYRTARGTEGPLLLAPDDDGHGEHGADRGAQAAVQPGIVRFPADTLDAQDYFGACDAVLAKGGYSTFSEAGLAGVPLLCFPIQGSEESIALCQQAEEMGLGVALSGEAEAREVLAAPERAIARARAAQRGPAEDAGPALLSILADEGLL